MQNRYLSRLPKRKLWAILALSAVTIAATPTYSESTKNHPETSKGAVHVGVIQQEGTIAENGTFVPDVTETGSGTWKVHKGVETVLTAFVLYNDKCEEVSHGQWTVTSLPKYGDLYGLSVKGHLGNGACSKYVYTGAGIAYKWVKSTSSKTDEFKAYWAAPGYKINVTFHLDLEK